MKICLPDSAHKLIDVRVDAQLFSCFPIATLQSMNNVKPVVLVLKVNALLQAYLQQADEKVYGRLTLAKTSVFMINYVLL